MGWQGHRGQGKVVRDIIQRAGLGDKEYLSIGHPDAFFRDGVRREIKGRSDKLTTEQRTQLMWMSKVGQPWEILQETHSKVVLCLRSLAAYDAYYKYKNVLCDWTKRYAPKGAVLAHRSSRCGIELKTRCGGCKTPLWNTLVRAKKLGIENLLCRRCARLRRDI
jgi:hypothetical protein